MPTTLTLDSTAAAAPRCLDVLSPGEVFEHWCALDAGHACDHRCGDCGDVWNPADPQELDEFGAELHDRFDGTCPECRAHREGDR